MTMRQALRRPFVTTPVAERVDLGDRRIIVTGCSPGSLGYATALQLAQWGATVIVTTRRGTKDVVTALNADCAQPDRAQPDPSRPGRSWPGQAWPDRSRPGKIDGHELDLSDVNSVIKFSQWYDRFYGERLDVLVNNAGIHLDLLSEWKDPRLSRDGCEIHWRTNYLGTAHLIDSMLPLLRETGRGAGEARIVNVVSQLHSRGSNELLFNPHRTYDSWQAYGLSKLALIHCTNELHRRYAQADNLKSYSLHPGGRSGTYTNIASGGLAGHPFIALVRRCVAPLEKALMSSAAEGAQTQIHCATAAAAEGGRYYANCRIAQGSADTLDESAARRLWDETQAWLRAQ